MCCRRWKRASNAPASPASSVKSRGFPSTLRAACNLRGRKRRHGARHSPLAQHNGKRSRGRAERGGDALAHCALTLRPRAGSMVCRANTGSWIYCACAVANRIHGFWRHAMRRVISLYLPHWPSDRLRRAKKDAPPRDKPLVTAMMQGQRRVIASVDAAAARLDLSCGMTVTHAQSLIPDLTVIDATPEEDEAALMRLALWCIKYLAAGHAQSAGRHLHRCGGLGAFVSGRSGAHRRSLPAAPGGRHRGQGRARRYGRLLPGRSRATVMRKSFRLAAPRKRSPACRSQACGYRPRPSRL